MRSAGKSVTSALVGCAETSALSCGRITRRCSPKQGDSVLGSFERRRYIRFVQTLGRCYVRLSGNLLCIVNGSGGRIPRRRGSFSDPSLAQPTAREGDSMQRQQIVFRDPEVMNGALVFAGTRVPVKILVQHLAAGDRLEPFLDDFPSVSRDQAVAYLDLTLHQVAAGG